jgi:acyl dehydratase
MRDPRVGIDFSMIVHGEERVVWHRAIPSAGTIVARHRITHIIDKGEGRGAIVVYDKDLFDKTSGAALATVTHTTFCRGDGGFSAADGRSDKADSQPAPVPARAPDLVCEMATLPQQALLYRLSADRNPLHSNPEAARRAGFERPILHGLCTWGIAGHALLARCCDYDPARLVQMYARFSSPVYPGEPLGIEIWRADAQGEFAFRAKASARDKIVLDFGRASVRP